MDDTYVIINNRSSSVLPLLLYVCFIMSRFLLKNRKKLYTVERLEELHDELVVLVSPTTSTNTNNDTDDGDGGEVVAGEDDDENNSADATADDNQHQPVSPSSGRISSNSNESHIMRSHRRNFRRSIRQILGECSKEEIENSKLKKQDMKTAFRGIKMSPSDDQEVQGPKCSLEELEEAVINAIRSIGEVVVNSEPSAATTGSASAASTSPQQQQQTLRSDDVFEYFCETAMLQFLLEIASEKPSNSPPSTTTQRQETHYHGIVWSPAVKSQILITVSMLVSGVRDTSALYFILSQNCVNELIKSFLPLQQWTDLALKTILPSYVALLQNLALQLSASPHLFPCFTEDNGEIELFPLFMATLDTAIYAYSQSNSFTHATCLTLIVDLMRIEQVNTWCDVERRQYQSKLSNHLSRLFIDRYKRLVTLTNGPIVNAVRSNTISNQISGLDDSIILLNDIFFSHVNGFNVCLCETLLSRLVSILINALIPYNNSKCFLTVGLSDSDVIPEPEARAQVATFFLSRLFSCVDYDPFSKMLAVTLFHPRSTQIWQNLDKERDKANTTEHSQKESYVLTLALNAIAQGKATDDNFVDNPYRAEIVRSISGTYGEYRAIPTTILLANALESESLDVATLQTLDVLPCPQQQQQQKQAEGQPDGSTAFELAIATFLSRQHTLQSTVSTMALECAASLSVILIHKATYSAMTAETTKGVTWSPVRNALDTARSYFFRKTLESQEAVGVSDISVELIESAVKGNYKRTTVPVQGVSTGPAVYAFVLSQHGVHCFETNSEVLIRRLRGVECNDVEATRFYAHMAFHFRAVCRVVGHFVTQVEEWKTSGTSPRSQELPTLDTMDKADNFLASIFGSVQDKPARGTDIDLRGRMVFRFASGTKGDSPRSKTAGESRSRTFSDDMIFRASSHLALVLDPKDMFVIKPFPRNSARGTVICCIPLLRIIAAAADDDWLHVAVRHNDVGFLIKNGNMALRFESSGTCLIVRQYLERCRAVLRGELKEKITGILRKEQTTKVEDKEDSPEPQMTTERADGS